MVNRWQIYNYLKGGSNEISVKDIERAPVEELREGLIEFILYKRLIMREEKERAMR
ncbi:hypothetical protein [Clostridium kluyveri]|uniref:Uncharacterized protein n=1 Tax=Clostridium kluyveri (strain ATCC 8527 / DSM 555 / NBRC 12016 / NCIMB 10680 / K1) TaxID=431943 RepID=A5MYQ4_CLOK5|nr:hypothetical protein [Clostridium kluyveri]ABS30681.1 Hypothetical protein CKL_1891 [Clostridium kluyveri DSM 555]EDK34000.1 Hypothetical protein CKL_1988 [Clostridium kluyveri DSM 555]